MLLAVSAASLLFVLTQPALHGAHRWLRYSWISFQPSEIAKLVLLIYIADFLHKYESEINSLRQRLLPCLAVVLFFAALIAVEPDLGQAMCILLIIAVLLFAAGLSWKYVAAATVTALPALYLAVWYFPYRFRRVLAFLYPSQDPLGHGWQISQSLTAIGSGGVLGLGLGASKHKLFYLPEPHSDFIFAIIGEELGLIGTSVLCLAFLLFFYRGIKIALRAPDPFGFYLGLGISLMVVMQAFINISMVLALMPTKGIALPFISQGGSSLLLNLMATGVLLNISNYAEKA
jgi:cell division protein FtsW